MRIKIFLALSVTVLSGCAALNKPDAFYQAQAIEAQAYWNAQASAGITGSCDSKCEFTAKFPSQGRQKIDPGVGSAEVAIAGVEAAGGAIFPATLGYVIGKVVDRPSDVEIDGGDGGVSYVNDQNIVTTTDTQRTFTAKDNDLSDHSVREDNKDQSVREDNSQVAEPFIVRPEVVTKETVKVVDPVVVTNP